MCNVRSVFRLGIQAAGLVCLVTPALGQKAQVFLKKSDPILGHPSGTIVSFDELAIGNDGVTFLNVSGDQPGVESVILVNGGPALTRGLALNGPVGATFLNASAMSVSQRKAFGWNLKFAGTDPEMDSGVYWNTFPLTQRGTPPSVQQFGGVAFSPSTTHGPVSSVIINDSDELLVTGNLVDPDLNGKESYAAILRVDAMGGLLSEDFLAIRGYALPGSSQALNSVITSPGTWALNDRGSWMGLAGDPQGVFLLKDNVEVARTGMASGSHPGFNVISFVNLSMNNHGDYVVNTKLDGPRATNAALVVNGTHVVVTKSDTIPAATSAKVQSLDGPPLWLADSGDVFWYASTDGNAGEDEVYLRSVATRPGEWRHEVIVQKGITTVGGVPIQSLRAHSNAYAASDDGRFWIGEVLLGNGDEAVVVADFGTSVPVHGCDGVNQGTLSRTAGNPLIGSTLSYEVDGPILPGDRPILMWSSAPAIVGSSCGVRAGMKEILIHPGIPYRFAQRVGEPYSNTPVLYRFSLPPDPALVDRTVYGQAIFVNANGHARMTNAVAMTIGQPNC